MRRQRKGGGSLWGSKKRSKSLRNKPERGVRELQESKKVVAPADVTDYGQFYDKINAREKCDDLVLLEKVTNEGIVEVSRLCFVYFLESYQAGGVVRLGWKHFLVQRVRLVQKK